MPVLAGRGSNLAKHTYESKINLAEGGPDFASFAKFGDKIANLATALHKGGNVTGGGGERALALFRCASAAAQGTASMERFSAFSATSSTQELHSVL